MNEFAQRLWNQTIADLMAARRRQQARRLIARMYDVLTDEQSMVNLKEWAAEARVYLDGHD